MTRAFASCFRPIGIEAVTPSMIDGTLTVEVRVCVGSLRFAGTVEHGTVWFAEDIIGGLSPVERAVVVEAAHAAAIVVVAEASRFDNDVPAYLAERAVRNARVSA